MAFSRRRKQFEAFLNDSSPNAYEKVVDQLLASPHYGERWARHWLDLARYAESEGFKSDETRPNAWRYRDYVINSLQSTTSRTTASSRSRSPAMNFGPNDPEARVATGFNRHYPDESNARNLMQRRQEILNDITDTVGAVFLGPDRTAAPAATITSSIRLPQADYYRLQAFFANTSARMTMPLVSKQQLAEYHAKRADLGRKRPKTSATRWPSLQSRRARR